MTNAIRELGGVLGVAVLATVFTSHGGYASPQTFINGLIPAVWVGVAVLGATAALALVLPFRTRASGPPPAPAGPDSPKPDTVAVVEAAA